MRLAALREPIEHSRMHLGVSAHHTDPADGGITQYTMSVFRALAARPSDFAADRLTLFGSPSACDAAQSLHARFDQYDGMPPHSSGAVIGRRLLGTGAVRRMAVAVRGRLSARRRHDPTATAGRNAAGDWLRARGVDIAYAPADNHQLLVESGLPAVITVHDIEHIRQPHLPEHQDGYFERVEYLLRNAARCAALVVANSETGKADLLEWYTEYGLTPDRVAIVPYTVPPHIRVDRRTEEAARVRHELKLPERYVFYPAQFQPRKNHVRLVEALGIIKMRAGLRVPLVLSGAQNWPLAAQTWRTLMTTATRMGIADQIHYVGVVQNQDMTGLYAAASALVMPSYTGPMNIPLIEAWALGCPVITSDIRGIREMCGDAALLVPPSSADDIADAILSIWNDDAFAAEMATRGLARATVFSPERFANALWSALRRAKATL
ncbi:MAG: glycosyltransferase family 1 protein [Gemmatimonadaceae bacterium]